MGPCNFLGSITKDDELTARSFWKTVLGAFDIGYCFVPDDGFRKTPSLDASCNITRVEEEPYQRSIDSDLRRSW